MYYACSPSQWTRSCLSNSKGVKSRDVDSFKPKNSSFKEAGKVNALMKLGKKEIFINNSGRHGYEFRNFSNHYDGLGGIFGRLKKKSIKFKTQNNFKKMVFFSMARLAKRMPSSCKP
ncbi:hypothetical protein IEQ34_002870 [Dendrobium chrysotoxum]|uniref:Uncharacterized protein n=1 Tax=Dendrobium chrysotoxum TaxID=161865 RepID=A0AAV7HJ54_DENCH|nr:hypothetical protein IEQ34_002870 [Dendrobium chrysotoxum]